MDKIKWGLIAFLTGGIIAYFLLPRVPDIRIVKETLVVTKTVDRIINKDRIIDRKIYVSTSGTVVTEEHEVIKDRIIEKEKEKIVEKTIDKTINYTGSVFVLYNPFDLKIYPDIIGVRYLVINPISLIGEYDIENKKTRIGLNLDF